MNNFSNGKNFMKRCLKKTNGMGTFYILAQPRIKKSKVLKDLNYQIGRNLLNRLCAWEGVWLRNMPQKR